MLECVVGRDVQLRLQQAFDFSSVGGDGRKRLGSGLFLQRATARSDVEQHAVRFTADGHDDTDAALAVGQSERRQRVQVPGRQSGEHEGGDVLCGVGVGIAGQSNQRGRRRKRCAP
jgi:hypothetical protein